MIERWKTGRLSKGEADKNEYALYHEAASKLFEAYEVRAVLLADGDEEPLTMTNAKRKNLELTRLSGLSLTWKKRGCPHAENTTTVPPGTP